jgi:allophanate hydrolase subunit 2
MALDTLCSSDDVVAAAADRMGLRLSGQPVHGDLGTRAVLSLPTIPGVIQVPPDGGPIVLLADCQTTGGYPIRAVVCTADVPTVGRLQPAQAVTFTAVGIGGSHRATRERDDGFENMLGAISITVEPQLDVDALYAGNLGGVVAVDSTTPHEAGGEGATKRRITRSLRLP